MKNLALAGLVGLSLSACVTINAPMDGMDNANDSVVTQYPIETALLNIYTRERTETLYAVDETKPLVSQIKVVPKGFMSFEGRQLQTAQMTTLTTTEGKVVGNAINLNYYSLNPLKFYGFTNNLGQYSVATQTATLPKRAQTGAASELLTETVYTDSSKRQQVSQFTQAWTLSQASNHTAWFCLNTSENQLTNGKHKGSSSHCYNIDAKGDILDSKLTVNQPTIDGTKTIHYLSK
ncbi:hypothetical protein ACTXGJ_09785 [Psychrobacter sp. 1Y11]|uniref:hypothetical protein n=1 Tax=Psychrobacter sp. 1Y11 TaxID=3457446 RepID=UPI003FD63757